MDLDIDLLTNLLLWTGEMLKRVFFFIEFCLPGQQYNRNILTCQYCPKDFYTNKTISQYCIKCPAGYITYGEGSVTCVKLFVPGTDIATFFNICEFAIQIIFFMCFSYDFWLFISCSLIHILAKRKVLFFSFTLYSRLFFTQKWL